MYIFVSLLWVVSGGGEGKVVVELDKLPVYRVFSLKLQYLTGNLLMEIMTNRLQFSP